MTVPGPGEPYVTKTEGSDRAGVGERDCGSHRQTHSLAAVGQARLYAGQGLIGFTRAIVAVGAVAIGAAVVSTIAAAQALVPFEVTGDEISKALTAEPGNPARGLTIATSTNEGACLLCHVVPGSTQRFMGNVAPTLAGVGARLNAAQLRLRIVDSTRINPNSPMPAYYRIDGLNQVASAYRGKPVLSAAQVEDLVAWLATLKEAPTAEPPR